MRAAGLAIAMILGLASAGCAVTEELNTMLFDTRKVNLTGTSYAAADMLAQQTRDHINQMTPVRVAVLTDVATPNEVTPFGQHISNQVGSRFVQLGYNVRAVPLPSNMMAGGGLPGGSGAPVALNNGAPKPTQTGILPSQSKNESVITGTYTRLKDVISISLRVIQAPNDRIVAAYDYTIPMTRELREMSMSKGERAERAAKNPIQAITTN